jgi:hypothetical protein
MDVQATQDTWLHWLYTNAPAAWLSALAASIAFILALRSRKKPKRLVVREVRNSSVVRIWPTIRHKISMTFEDRPIKSLAQIEAEIFNEGSETIEHPEFTLDLPDGCTVLGVSITPGDPQAETVIDAHSIAVALRYVNALSEHGHVLRLSVLADGDTDPVKISGSGPGWSIRHLPVEERRTDFSQLWVMLASFAYFVLMLEWYVPLVGRRYGIGPYEISWRAVAAGLPIIVPGVILAVAMARWFILDLRRMIRARMW